MSKAVQALGVLLFTPLYLRILGLEAVGLVGLWTTVRSFLTLLDFGMSTTLNREIAAARESGSTGSSLWNLLRTLEAISLTIAIVAASAFAVLAPWTAHHWLHLSALSAASAISALVFLGCASAFQLPTILYQGGLTGLERQVPMNVVIILFSLTRDIGSLVALKLFAPTIVTFFAWQALVSAAQCLAQRAVLTRLLPSTDSKPVVDLSRVREIGRFTAGTGLISLTVMFLGLTDGIVLTRFVPLAMYGVFALAQTAAGAILIVVSPLTTAAFPRFVALVVSDRLARLTEVYHEFSQLIVVAVYPLASVMIAFSGSVLLMWTGKKDIAEAGRVSLSLVALATACNALLYLPLQAQLAAKWTSLTLVANAISVVVFVPAIVVLSARLGIDGASLGLLGLMVAQLVIIPALMHRRLMRGSGGRWYVRDLFLPAIPSLVLSPIAASVIRMPSARMGIAGVLAAYWLLLLVATLACAPLARRRVLSFTPWKPDAV